MTVDLVLFFRSITSIDVDALSIANWTELTPTEEANAACRRAYVIFYVVISLQRLSPEPRQVKQDSACRQPVPEHPFESHRSNQP